MQAQVQRKALAGVMRTGFWRLGQVQELRQVPGLSWLLQQGLTLTVHPLLLGQPELVLAQPDPASAASALAPVAAAPASPRAQVAPGWDPALTCGLQRDKLAELVDQSAIS